MEFKAHKTYGPDRTAAFGIPGPQIASQGFMAPSRHVEVPDSFETASAEDLEGLTPDQVVLVRRAESERECLARFLRARNAEYDAINHAPVSESKPRENELSRRKSIVQKVISERRRRRARGPVRSALRPNGAVALRCRRAIRSDAFGRPASPSGRGRRCRGPPQRARQPHRRRLQGSTRKARGRCVKVPRHLLTIGRHRSTVSVHSIPG